MRGVPAVPPEPALCSCAPPSSILNLKSICSGHCLLHRDDWRHPVQVPFPGFLGHPTTMPTVTRRRAGASDIGEGEEPSPAATATTSTSAAHDAAVAATTGGVPRRRPVRRSAPSLRALLSVELTAAHLRSPHILHWYRPVGGFRKSLGSLFRLHNETVNVWSHLIGGAGPGKVGDCLR